MSKNMTKKGLAISAGLSLVAVGLVAAPAQAAPTSLSIKAVAGDQSDTQNSVLGAQFLVATTAVGAAAGAIEYYITGADKADFADIDYEDVTSLSTLTQLDSDVDTGAIDDSVLSNVADPTGTAATDTTVANTWAAGKFNVLGLTLDTSAVTETTTITITPFVDNEVNNGVPDANELTGNTLTITFHKASEVTATATLDAFAPVSSGGILTANVVLDKNINMASTVNAATVTFKENGADYGTTNREAFWNVADQAYTAASTAGELLETAVYGASPKVLGASSAGTTNLLGATVGQIDVLGDLAVSNGTSYAASGDVVRTVATGGSGTITVSSTITTLEAASKLTGAFAGHTVFFKISELANGDLGTATITSEGKTLTNATSSLDSITVSAVTNSSGKASIDISYSGLKDGNQFDVDPFAYGADALATGGTNIEFTGQNSAAKYLFPVDHVGGTTMTASAGTDPVAAINAGDTVSIRYRLADQFGQAPAGTHRLSASLTGGSGTQTSTVAFGSDGFGTVTFVDNSISTGQRPLTTLDLRVLNSDGVTYDAVSGATERGAQVYASASALKAPSRVTLSSTTTQALNSITIRGTALVANHDERFGGAVATQAVASGTDNVLSGVVFGTDGAVRPGAVITLSAPDVMFVQIDAAIASGNEAVYSYGSITVVADESGRYGNIAYFSNVAGARTITSTSGSATKTLDVVFDGVDDSSGSAWQVTAPSTVQPGSTFSVTAKLVDKYGNAVDSEANQTDITYTGPGLVVGTLPTQTGSDGTLKFSVLLGQNDSGTATIVIDEHGADNITGTGTTNGGVRDNVDNITATVTITIGDAPVVVPEYGTLKAWTVDQGDGTVKVYVKYPTLGDKVRIGHQTGGSGSYETIFVKTIAAESDSALTVNAEGYYIVRTIDLDSGTNRIRVTVGDNTEVQVRYNE